MSLAYVCDSNGCTFIERVRSEGLPNGWTEVNLTKAGPTKSQAIKKIYQLCPGCSTKAERDASGMRGLPE